VGEDLVEVLQLFHRRRLCHIKLAVRLRRELFIMFQQVHMAISGHDAVGFTVVITHGAGYHPSMPHIRFIAFLVVLLIAACSEPAGKPVPVGDYGALEQLAEAYRAVSKELPVSPRGMRPEGRRQFLERVFAKAGYDYSASLQALSQQMDVTNKDHRDLADLLLMPQTGLADDDLDKVFSPAEVEAVKAIKKALR
jgi:hypothetical protein